MKILITGITGLVGQEAAKALLSNGHEVIGAVRTKDRAKTILPGNIGLIEWSDLQNTIPPEDLLGIEAVVHLMGENIGSERWTKQRKKALFDSRVLATRTLIQSFKNANIIPKVWVQASAIGIYGSSSKMVHESSPESVEGYLATLSQAWEKSLGGLSNETRLVVMRLGVILSHQGGALKEILSLYKKGLGGIVGTGYQWMSFIHLEDVVRFVEFALEKNHVKGKYNLVADSPATQAEFAHAVGYKFGFRLGLPAPEFILKLVLGERAELVLNSNRIRSERLKADGFELKFSNLDKILSAIAKAKLATERAP